MACALDANGVKLGVFYAAVQPAESNVSSERRPCKYPFRIGMHLFIRLKCGSTHIGSLLFSRMNELTLSTRSRRTSTLKAFDWNILKEIKVGKEVMLIK